MDHAAMAVTHNPCECSRYRTKSGQTTGCTQAASRRFLPGHDAKLKSFLIQAGVDGEQVKCLDDVLWADPVFWASRLGYGEKVQAGIDRGVARKQGKRLTSMGKVTVTKESADIAKIVADQEAAYREEQRRLVQERQDSADW